MCTFCRFVPLIAWLVGLPAIALAQPAQSFEQAKLLLAAGDDLTVVHGSGTITRGKLSTIGSGELVVDARGGVQRWREADVREIRLRTNDSLLNGAMIGAGVGAGLGSLLYLDNECRGDPACARAVVQGAAVSAGIGALIDALIRRNRIVYQRAPTGTTWFVHPIFPGVTRRAGMRISVRF